MSSNQDKSIEFFLKFIGDNFCLNTEVIEEPDKRIRNSEACDAIAIIGKKNVAIEHTSIDSYKNQREENALFYKFFQPIKEILEKELRVSGKFFLSTESSINLKGFDYDKVRLEIIEWCLKNAGNLEFGSPDTAPHHFISKKFKGIPFKITLYRWPGKNRVQLSSASFDEIKYKLQEVLESTLETRGRKVAKYSESGYRTVLLIESNEIQLLNDYIIREAFSQLPKKLEDKEIPDEIYLIMSGFEYYELYCLKFDDDNSLEINSEYMKIYKKIYIT